MLRLLKMEPYVKWRMGFRMKQGLNATMASKVKNMGASPWENIGDSGRGLLIDQFLTFHLVRLANAAKTNVTRRYLTDFNLSVPEWRLLALAMRFAPLRFSEMVERSNMDKGQVSRTLASMTKRGYINAKSIGPKPKRNKETISLPVVVSVTPKGRKLYEEVLPIAQRHQARLLKTLSPAERKTLHTVLTRLFETVESYTDVDEEQSGRRMTARAA
jgi:DNA-binding MarR family transcriptional regulator